MQRYVDFIAAKRGRHGPARGRPGFRGFARVLPSSDWNPRFGHFLNQRQLLARSLPISLPWILSAAARLCMHPCDQGPKQARRMVSLLVDGLRYYARSS